MPGPPKGGGEGVADRSREKKRKEATDDKRRSGVERLPVFAELFARYAGLTRAIQDECAGAAQVRSPHDEMYGSDLGNDQEFTSLIEEEEEEAPDWCHMAPPCRTFTKARRKDRHGHVKQLRSERKPEGFGCEQTKEANLLADRSAAVGERQLDRGKFFSIENPEGSFIWELPSFKRLAAKRGVVAVLLHQCAYGGPYHKPTILLTKCPWLKVGRLCKDAPAHSHTTLEGKVWSFKTDQTVWLTAEAAEYPTGMCEEWARLWKTWLEEQGPPKEKGKEFKMVKAGRFQNKLVREELADPAA